jgi:hypothetical protein
MTSQSEDERQQDKLELRPEEIKDLDPVRRTWKRRAAGAACTWANRTPCGLGDRLAPLQ